MSDKEKIRAEIESSMKGCEEAFNICPSTAFGSRIDSYKALLSFIDSLPEEPVSKDLEEEFNRFLDEEEGVPRMWHSNEQMEWGKDIAHHFANWQKQQLMKDAVDAIVHKGLYSKYIKEQDSDALSKALEGYNPCDRVKIIIIREEGK